VTLEYQRPFAEADQSAVHPGTDRVRVALQTRLGSTDIPGAAGKKNCRDLRGPPCLLPELSAGRGVIVEAKRPFAEADQSAVPNGQIAARESALRFRPEDRLS
jgi:hypothetical protein